jgi:heme/copper-type cytochrome/quinol oxidase subunit 2
MTNFFNLFSLTCDAPRPWGVYFQDSASPQMEALIELHDNIMFYLVIILFGVAWILISIIRNYVYSKSPISNKYLNHGTLIELIWTISPALILILIAFPTFKLLYLMDEVTDPSLTVFVEGHQWYWSYQYPDFLNNDDEELEFDSYLVTDSDLENGGLRSLEVDNKTGHVFLSDQNDNHINDKLINNGETPREMFTDDCNHDFGNFSREGDRLAPDSRTHCDLSTPQRPHALFKTTFHSKPNPPRWEAHQDKHSYFCKRCNILVCNDCFTQCNLNANFK